MPYNLLSEAWLPVRRRDGEVTRIRPAEVVAGLGTDAEPVEPAWPRADFDIATYEFLIGLLFAACPPEEHEDWKDWFRDPPSVAELDEVLAPYARAFDLDGDEPRFLQDLEPFEAEAKAKLKPIERLLIDAAGGNATKLNKDLQVHRDRYLVLGLPAAAIALYTLQQFSPGAGSGIRTSLRGGGPLSALVLPGDRETTPSLWGRVWANVPLNEDGAVREAEMTRAFPWLAKTRTSANGEAVSSERTEAHPAQAFFGMPLRIRLVFSDDETRCALTAEPAERCATNFVQKKHGIRYAAWRHPLTPYHRKNEGAEWLPFLTRPGRFGYRDWVGVVIGAEDGSRRPAESLAAYRAVRSYAAGEGRALVAGYATASAEVVDFLFAEQPLHTAAAEDRATALDSLAIRMAEAGEEAMRRLRWAVRDALFGEGAKADVDGSVLADVRAAFFDATEAEFHAILDAAVVAPDSLAHRERWRQFLERTALDQFQGHAATALRDPARDGARVAEAYRRLTAAFRGTRKNKQPIHAALELPWTEPEPRASLRPKNPESAA